MEEIMSIETTIPILGIIATTFVAIYSIRETAKANRVSSVHGEMIQCIIESIVNVSTVRNLLYHVSQSFHYRRIPDSESIETAYDRYWREIQIISTDFKLIQAKQMFVFPKELYKRMQPLINKINEGRRVAKDYTPKAFPPGNNELNKIVKEIDSIYVDFVNDARRYVGVDAIKRITENVEGILGVQETENS